MINLQTRFLDQVAPGSHFGTVFDYLPGISFFAKNQEFQLVAANRAFWERLGCKTEADLIGKTDFELFPERLAENFRRDDEFVIQSGEPRLNIVELFFNRQGLPDWYFTSKLPIHGKSGEVIGVMGTVQSYARRRAAITENAQLDRAVEHLRSHFRESISIPDLANLAAMSVRQFNRRFQELFGMNPRLFLVKTRLQAACEELRTSDAQISEIAVELG
ncbi:MAG: AraC family transcriptional regulator, partial [Verrucomicrobiota bacterium]